MARAKNEDNGRLEEAVTCLIRNQASFLAQIAEINRRIAGTERITSERFARRGNSLVLLESGVHSLRGVVVSTDSQPTQRW